MKHHYDIHMDQAVARFLEQQTSEQHQQMAQILLFHQARLIWSFIGQMNRLIMMMLMLLLSCRSNQVGSSTCVFINFIKTKQLYI